MIQVKFYFQLLINKLIGSLKTVILANFHTDYFT